MLSQAKVCVRVELLEPAQHGGASSATVLEEPSCASVGTRSHRDARPHQRHARAVRGDDEGQGERDFSFITRQRGMFSFTGLTPVQVEELRNGTRSTSSAAAASTWPA